MGAKRKASTKTNDTSSTSSSSKADHSSKRMKLRDKPAINYNPQPPRKPANKIARKKSGEPKATELMVNEDNRPVVEFLNEMSERYFKSGDGQRGIAYANASKHVRESQAKIKSGEDARHYESIGEHIAAHIDEFIKTGSVDRLDELRETTSSA